MLSMNGMGNGLSLVFPPCTFPQKKDVIERLFVILCKTVSSSGKRLRLIFWATSEVKFLFDMIS